MKITILKTTNVIILLGAFFIFWLYSTLTLQAQQPQEIAYKKAIDEINCAMVRELLISYDRPVVARNLYDCSYNNISVQVNKIKENTIKGYKKLILDAASDINGYKTKVSNPAEYSLFETALSDAKSLAVKRFEQVCEKNKGANNSVCVDMDKRAVKLQSAINDIVNTALADIAKNTYGGENAPKAGTPKTSEGATAGSASPKTDNNSNTSNAESSEEASMAAAEDKKTATQTDNSAEDTGSGQRRGGSSFWGFLQAALFIGLIAAVGWLYKENTELKEKLRDIEMLLKILNQRK